VLRGGSWNNNGNNCRSANRNNNQSGDRNNNIGFRVVVSVLTLHSPEWAQGNCAERVRGVQSAFRRCGRPHPKINRNRAGW